MHHTKLVLRKRNRLFTSSKGGLWRGSIKFDTKNFQFSSPPSHQYTASPPFLSHHFVWWEISCARSGERGRTFPPDAGELTALCIVMNFLKNFYYIFWSGGDSIGLCFAGEQFFFTLSPGTQLHVQINSDVSSMWDRYRVYNEQHFHKYWSKLLAAKIPTTDEI